MAALVSGFWFMKRYKSFTTEKQGSARVWEVCLLPGHSLQRGEATALPGRRCGPGELGQQEGPQEPLHPLFPVAEACRGAGREPLGPLCVPQQKPQAGLLEGLRFALQFTFLSAVLKTGGLFCS